MSYGTPGIPSSPPFIVTGTPSDGDVPTSDGAGGIAWEAGGGGGGGSGLAVVGTPYPGAKPRYNAEASPAEYTVDRWITDRIFDAADYGASGDSRQAVTSGSTAAGTSVTLASGQGAMFREGNHLVIPFAGAASTFAAVTPETPTLFTGGTAGATTVNISYSAMDGNGGYSPPSVAGAITTANATLSDSNYLTYWHRTTRLAGESVSFTAAASYVVVDWSGLEYTVMVVQVSSTGTLPAGLSASTYYWLRSQKTVPDPQRWSIHATHRDAVANVNPIAVDAGSGTHTITRYEEADGYVYFGRGTSNRFAIRRKSGAPNAFFVTFQAGGYTNAVAADIGRSVVYGGSARGTLRWYDNTARTWVVEMGNDAQSNYFPAASAVTITGGTGVGTTTGNAEEVHVLVDAGDTSAAYDHRTFAYRASTVYEEGDLVLSPFSASGVWYEVDATYDDRTSHSSAPTFDATLNNFTVDGGAALRFRRLNQIIPVAEPAGTLPQTYFGEVTAVATDTLTITPSTTSTVASGSMVAHNDFPATKTAFDALLSNGGGELFISGDHDWFTDAIGGNSWTARPGGAITWSLFGLAQSGTSLNRFRLRFGNGTTVRHRPLDVPALIYATSDQEGGCSLFNFVTAFRPEIDFAGGRLLCIPACEPGAEHDSSINTLLVASSTQGGSVNDVSQAPKMRDGTIAGFSGLGAFTNQVSAGSGLLCQDVHVRFSMGGGHDSGYSASSAGTFIRGSFEGVRRWGSTTCYTATSTLDPFRAHGVYFKNLRGDGLRLRSPRAFVSHCMFDGGPATGGTGVLLLENMVGAHVHDNYFRQCRGVNINGSGIEFHDNTLEDSYMQVTATSGSAQGNTFIGTSSWSVVGFSRFVLITAGTARFTFGPNVFDYTTSPTTTCDAIVVETSTAGAQIGLIGNRGRVFDRALRVLSAFVGGLECSDNQLYSNDNGGSSTVVDLQAGNGAIVRMTDNNWTGSAGADVYKVGNAASTAQYYLTNERSTLQLNVDADVSGAVVIDGGNFASATAAAIAKNGTVLRNVEFAVAPTLTGTGLFTKGCTVAGSPVSSPAALASGASALTLPVTDYVRLDPDAANSSLSGMTARAAGVEVFTVNVDAGAATLTYTNNSGVTEANEYLTDTGADFVDSANKTRAWWYDSTTAKWRNK